MTLAALHVTKCRLCGQPPAGAEGLCADCSRALTRARQGSAASRGGTAGAKKPRVVDRIVLTSPTEARASRRPVRGRAPLLAGLGVVAVIVLLAVTAKPQRPVELKPVERAPRVVTPLLEPATADDLAAIDALPTPTKASTTAELPPPKESTKQRDARGTRGAPSKAAVKPDTDGRPASDAPRASSVAPQIEPPVQQARVTAAATAMNVDDAQALASALEKCSGEKLLAGVICEQKVRLRFCEGKWGQTPQCTAKPRVD